MKVRSIDLDGDGNPSQITVTMTVQEAACLAWTVGKSTNAERDELLPGWGDAGTAIYDCLADLFNRFYDDGVGEYLRGG